MTTGLERVSGETMGGLCPADIRAQRYDVPPRENPFDEEERA
jgi:hypothetical protein